MIKIGSFTALAALAALLSAGFAAEATAAGKKAKGKSCGAYMYVDKKTKQCVDARNKK